MKKILVSACLLGCPCRYDGKSVPNSAVEAIRSRFEWIPICPERDGDLPTPRIPCEIRNGIVLDANGTDRTEAFRKGAGIALSLAKENGISYALLKEKSPSCGSNQIYDGTFSKTLIPGEGITASLLRKNGITVFSENEIDTLLSVLSE